jgi:drug/metabolite transporter, DME family
MQPAEPTSPPSLFETAAPRVQGVIYVLLAALLWSTGGVFIKSVSLDAFQISVWRSLFAAVTIFAITKPRKISIDATTLLASIAYAATLISFVAATKLTTAANAILLQYTAPIYILVLAHFILNERITLMQVGTVALCLGGMAIFFLDKISPEGYVGNLLAVLSGVCFAFMTVFLRKKRDDEPAESLLVGNLLIVLICGGVVVWQSLENPKGAMHPDVYFGFAVSTADSIMVAFLGIFQIGIPYILFTKGIRSLRALDASLVGMLEPVLNPIWVLVVIGEKPSVYAVIGGLVIIAAVLIQSLWSQQPKQLIVDNE